MESVSVESDEKLDAKGCRLMEEEKYYLPEGAVMGVD